VAERSQAAANASATPLTHTARVLLGMVAEGHATGYSIKAEIERSTRLYWGASIGGIYPELRRLEVAGLLSSRDDYRGSARRYAYRLTPAGYDALHAWLSDPGDPLLEMRHEALLRLRFAGVLAAGEQLELVRRMRAVHERRAGELRQRLDAGDFDDPLHRLTIEFGVGWNEWALAWCRGVEQGLRGETEHATA
jgi:DNA-binding PadR family transcriptional regulator